MATAADITVVSVADAPWDDVSTVFGERGDPAGCWCQFFKVPNAGWDSGSRDRFKGMLQEQVQANDPAPGVIAYAGGEPVGWCAIEPRPNYDRLRRSKVVIEGSKQKAEDASVWAITCFVVRVGYRRQGVAATLLQGAVDQARSLGARLIEGYPVDAEKRSGASSADLYHGTLSMFTAAKSESLESSTNTSASSRLASKIMYEARFTSDPFSSVFRTRTRITSPFSSKVIGMAGSRRRSWRNWPWWTVTFGLV